MKHILLIAALLAACSGPQRIEIHDSRELDAPVDLIRLEHPDEQGLGRAEQPLTTSHGFCWNSQDWKHEPCDMTDPDEICYCPRHARKLNVRWGQGFEYLDENDQYIAPFADVRGEILQGNPLIIDGAITHGVGEPGGGSSTLEKQVVRFQNVNWGIGIPTTESLDQALAIRVYCYSGSTYKGRAFGWGAKLYSCNRFGVDMDLSATNMWRIMHPSDHSTTTIFKALARHGLGAALGHPADSSQEHGNAMQPLINDESIPFTAYSFCQRDRGKAYSSSGSGVVYNPISCQL